MEFYGNKISKCPSLMKKSAPILGHRLLPSLSNKQLIINTFLRSPCIISRSIWGSDFVMKKPLHLKIFQVIAQYRQDTVKACPGDSK